MQTRQAHENVVSLAVAAIAQRHAPALGENAQDVLESVGGGDGPAGEADDFVVVAQPAAIGVGGFEDFGHDDAAVGVGAHPGAERGVIDDPAAVQSAEKVLDLVDRDGVADADVHPAAFLERAAAVDADQPALRRRTAARPNCRD